MAYPNACFQVKEGMLRTIIILVSPRLKNSMIEALNTVGCHKVVLLSRTLLFLIRHLLLLKIIVTPWP